MSRRDNFLLLCLTLLCLPLWVSADFDHVAQRYNHVHSFPHVTLGSASEACPATHRSGGVTHILDHKYDRYCTYRHLNGPLCEEIECQPAPIPDGLFASSNNNGNDHSCPNNNTGQPINIATGNKYFLLSEMVGEGVSPLRFALYFNSNANAQSLTSTYQQSLLIDEDVSVIAVRANGQKLGFAQHGTKFVAQTQRPERLSYDSSYSLRLANGIVETYSNSGRLTSIRYPSGIEHTLTYGTNRIYINRSTAFPASADRFTLTLDEQGRVIRVRRYSSTDILHYSYETARGMDRLVSIRYPDGTERSFLYENIVFPHFITGIINENGQRISSVVYDSQGRAISSEAGELGSGIERSQITYHDNGSRTVTNSLGKQTTYHFTEFNGEFKMTQVEGHASNNCAAANQAYTYDSNGFMASKTDWQGNVTTYEHNNRGLEISRTEASGTDSARTITTEWHPTFNLRTRVTEPARITHYAYDDQGRLISQEVTPR